MMRKQSSVRHITPLRLRPPRNVPAAIPPEDWSRGGPEAIKSAGQTAIRVATANLVPPRRPTDRPLQQPLTDGGSKGAAKALAGSSPALWEFLEWEHGGGI
jgi:hypothetical protein